MSSAAEQGASKTGRWMAWFAAIGLLAGLTAWFQATQREAGGMTERTDASGRAMIVLNQDRSGHYLAEGAINGQPVIFLVDSGATDVALSEKMARQFGVDFGPEVMVMTAAGPVQAWRTRLDSVSVGSITLNNVRATITRAGMSEVLLGMSFLKHFSLRQQGEELIIESGDAT